MSAPLTDEQIMKRTLAGLALGRIMRIASRPEQPGDVEEYYRCRALILDALEPTFSRPDNRPNWTSDRQRGAPGQ